MKRLVIGCGYLGRRVAAHWARGGDEVWALTRSSEHARAFEAEDIRPLVGDVLDRQSLRRLPAADTLLYAVGYDRSAQPDKRTVSIEGLKRVLNALSPETGLLIYTSSTSVYGQSQGEWVDEESQCRPATDRGRICLDAEALARRAFTGRQGVSVLRLSGIYGPGRLAARTQALREQHPITASPDGWLNLIHVDDAAAAVVACAALKTPVETLVVCDDRPLVRREYYAMLAAAIEAPPARFETGSQGDLGKRCSNRRLREELGVALRFPTILEGLPTAVGGSV